MTGASVEAVRAALATAHREEWASVFGGVMRLTGDWTLAEDCAQDAFERALLAWTRDGIPRVPGAWLLTTARHRALDVLRRAHRERGKLRLVAAETPEAVESADAIDGHDPDSLGADDIDVADERLRLLFTCCHPALALESRVALTLRVVGGLTTAEIAHAFLVSEATMSQRLLRTKNKIVHAGIPYRVPGPELLPERVSGVLAVIYLIFTEGHAPSDGSTVRDALAEEAIRLARLVVRLLPAEPEPRELLALLLLTHARRAARLDDAGELVTLEQQDRSRWNVVAIAEGLELVEAFGAAPASDAGLGGYGVQAAIAAVHARAGHPDDTDWDAIVALYDGLRRRHPSPVLDLNRAVALGFRDGPAAGLAALEALEANRQLAGNHLLAAARADALRRLGRVDEAVVAYRLARTLAPSEAERRLFDRRIGECQDAAR
ncbi:RNA polymerase sigma factor [Lysinimonas soli]|uniref:RNA polymerase sigma factor n=1 Tax=Lysinimonas soli TaxID=1074233 RepID=A0ABW0NPZ5_9MICO